MKTTAIIILILWWTIAAACLADPVWPPEPADPRVAWDSEIRCADLSRERGFFGKVGKILGGGDDSDRVSRPFDVVAVGEYLFMTCQDLPALVRVNVGKRSFRLYECDDHPLVAPIAVAARGGEVFVTDSGNGTVYRLEGDDLRPYLTKGLERPTGLAFLPGGAGIVVIDTGDHSAKVFDEGGSPAGLFAGRGEFDQGFNYPTFAVETVEGVLINDTLNYRMKYFDGDGVLTGAFGEEGDGPGTLARPKGIGVDPGGNVWVADAIFDNVQVFDSGGRLLLVIGTTGQGPGEFWTPGGLDVHDGLVYVADTYNDRIQVLRNLGGDHE